MALREVRNRRYWTPTDGTGGLKFIIVAVDYLTKWAEAIPLSTITKKEPDQVHSRTHHLQVQDTSLLGFEQCSSIR